ncbi:MAG: hypothetical protein WAX80_02410 [Minisyncoccia bacterium]
MFRKAGSEILICCDYDLKTLRVGTDTPLLPGYRGFFREIASFKTPEEWGASQFTRQVTDEQIQDMIAWFWIDMSTENADSTRP